MNKVIRTTWIILLLTVASGMAKSTTGTTNSFRIPEIR